MKEVRIPQLGEGLREVRIVKIECRAGQPMRRGDTLLSVETDKSVVDVECPFDGQLARWLVHEGAIVPVGAVVALATGVNDGKSQASEPDVIVPPRTRTYAAEQGLDTETLRQVPAADGRRLYPSDIDRFLRDDNADAPQDYLDHVLSRRQSILNFRFRRSADVVVPASLSVEIDGALLRAESSGDGLASATQRIAYAVALAAATNPKMRSALIDQRTLREYQHVTIGVAVTRSDGNLVTAVVSDADTLSFTAFAQAYRKALREAAMGNDQADEDVQILITSLDDFGVVYAVPTLVAPANSAIFVGAEDRNGFRRLVMTFDHRIMNGFDAARFLSNVAARVAENAIPSTAA